MPFILLQPMGLTGWLSLTVSLQCMEKNIAAAKKTLGEKTIVCHLALTIVVL